MEGDPLLQTLLSTLYKCGVSLSPALGIVGGRRNNRTGAISWLAEHFGVRWWLPQSTSQSPHRGLRAVAGGAGRVA